MIFLFVFFIVQGTLYDKPDILPYDSKMNRFRNCYTLQIYLTYTYNGFLWFCMVKMVIIFDLKIGKKNFLDLAIKF